MYRIIMFFFLNDVMANVVDPEQRVSKNSWVCVYNFCRPSFRILGASTKLPFHHMWLISKLCLKGPDIRVLAWFSAFFTRGTHLVNYFCECVISLVFLLTDYVPPSVSKFFPFRVTPFSERKQKPNWTELLPLKVYPCKYRFIHLLVVVNFRIITDLSQKGRTHLHDCYDEHVKWWYTWKNSYDNSL